MTQRHAEPQRSPPPPPDHQAARLWLLYGVGMLLALPFYLLFATERFTTLARGLAWLGLGAATLPSLVMMTRPKSPRASVAATGLNIVLFYHLAVFHERVLPLRWGHARISDASVESALLLAALATPALWLGWFLSGTLVLRRLLPHLRFDVPLRTLRRVGMGVVLVSLCANIGWVYGLLPTSGAALSVLAVLTPSELGLTMMLMPTLLGQPGRDDRRDFLIVLGLYAVLALGSGQIIVVMRPIIVFVLGGLLISRRLRLLPVLVGALVVLIMQPVKAEFRARTWDRPVELSLSERAGLYVELVAEHWFGDRRPLDTGESLESAASRTAAALALANYMELTPTAVPHQDGATYRYLKYALVPRIIYPDKPRAQDADVWAAVMYGYTSWAGTAHVMIGLSQIAESYVNFGFFGGLLALVMIGVLYRALDELLGHAQAGSGALSIYVYFTLSAMISSEGSAGQFWGGLLQLLLFYGTLMFALSRYALRRAPAGQ